MYNSANACTKFPASERHESATMNVRVPPEGSLRDTIHATKDHDQQGRVYSFPPASRHGWAKESGAGGGSIAIHQADSCPPLPPISHPQQRRSRRDANARPRRVTVPAGSTIMLPFGSFHQVFSFRFSHAHGDIWLRAGRACVHNSQGSVSV